MSDDDVVNIGAKARSRAPDSDDGVDPRRLTVQRNEGFVVFLIGARVNKWWMLPVLWAVAMANRRIMRELAADPESGLLSYEAYGGRTSLTVQYWRSLTHLHRYARSRRRSHAPAWRQWIQDWGLGGVMGIWHETYIVEPGGYENIYQHMPPFGLGRVGPRIPAEGELKTAAGRIAASRSGAPVGDPPPRNSVTAAQQGAPLLAAQGRPVLLQGVLAVSGPGRPYVLEGRLRQRHR